MPLFILSALARVGIPERFRALAGWGIAAVVAGLIVWLLITGFRSWLADERSDAIALNQAEISAAVSNQIIEADRSANVNAIAADEIAHDNEKELNDAVRESDNSSVGPGVSAVLARMRAQQASGKR